MLRAYFKAALSARYFRQNRPRLPFTVMSNKFALSDMKRYAERQFNIIAGFREKCVGWPEFMRFKHFPEKRVGVHEILYRYL
jgi:hypothetical protein